ncbi:alpha/beta fold hydrolase [Candidatus Chloroploca sp. M-50]|uniref:Alpha/beta fold hydrolase n=1 Tax=Candidatus Chloroploca mongolica TaxID=2528176 RepID=A0ABS4DG04_9CHLR|nr:alpha/beta fold hydrolase [Candidatus Chloroploca mongolica]MBP1468379.1 alpha/beta fold hydrolase [Candidatus Chloroploca mongolica]
MSDYRCASTSAIPWTVWAQSIVNGAVGDYLVARQNGLGIDMALYAEHRPLPMTREAFRQAYPRPTPKVCLLVHGLGCNEGSWSYRDSSGLERETSYGAELAADLGFTPLFVRYNTGLSIARNGQSLAALLTALLEVYPVPIEQLVLIGHSMGGLVIRHACYVGTQHHHAWVQHVRKAFYLGSPHEGAPLAWLSDVAAQVLCAVPHPITRLIGDVFNVRSQGIKELRAAPRPHAHAHFDAPPHQTLPWLSSAQHYLIYGTLASDPEHLVSLLLGDGLVVVPSIPPTSPKKSDLYPILPNQLACFPQTDHLQLACDPMVYQQIYQWCATHERSA